MTKIIGIIGNAGTDITAYLKILEHLPDDKIVVINHIPQPKTAGEIQLEKLEKEVELIKAKKSQLSARQRASILAEYNFLKPK